MGPMEGIEVVEELDLSLGFTGQELNIVHQQDVEAPVLPFEVLTSVVPDRVDPLIRVFLDRHIPDAQIGPQLKGSMPDGVKNVGLPQPRATPNKERIIGLSWVFRDSDGRSPHYSVPLTSDKIIEGVVLV